GPGPGHDLALALGGLDHRAEQAPLLVVREGRGLARGTRHHQAVGAVVEQVRGELLRAVEIQGIVVAERGDHRREHRSEPAAHELSSARWGKHTAYPWGHADLHETGR